MTLAATKEFMDMLFVYSDKDDNYSDLIQFLKNEIFGVTFICDFNSTGEFTDALKDNPLLEMLMDKYDKIKFNPNLESELQNDLFYQNLNEENLFLTSLNHEECDKLSKERGYIYISSDNISRGWAPIKYVRNNGAFKVTNDSKFPVEMKFNNWSKLEDFCLPLTSIIIFDRYLLGDKSNQKLQDNLFKILDKFCVNNLRKPLNLTIISNFDNDIQIVKSFEKITNYLQNRLITNVKINILRHVADKYPKNFEGLHYRLILTNNIRIKCDDSFNFFKSNGEINNDADLYVSFNLNYSKKCFYDKELRDLKRYVSMLKNHSAEVNLTDKIFYFQDKDNYLFN